MITNYQKAYKVISIKKDMKGLIFKNITWMFANKLEVEVKGEKEGEIIIDPRNFAYYQNDGNPIYRRIPKDLSKEIKPNEKDRSFSTELKYATKENNSLLMAISCFNGAYAECVHQTDFVAKIENNRAKFSEPLKYNFQNLRPKIIGLTNSMVAYDVSWEDMNDEKTESFQNAMKEYCSNQDIYDLTYGNPEKAILEIYESEMNERKKESLEGNLGKVNVIDLNFR